MSGDILHFSHMPSICAQGQFSPGSGSRLFLSNGHNRVYFIPLLYCGSRDSCNKIV